jgi:hypothetical protein
MKNLLNNKDVKSYEEMKKEVKTKTSMFSLYGQVKIRD